MSYDLFLMYDIIMHVIYKYNDIISKGEFEQVNVLDYRRTCGCYIKFSHLPNIKDLGLFRFHGI